MSFLQRYNRVILTVAAIVLVPSAVYSGVVLRDKFGSPTHYSTKAAKGQPLSPNATSNDTKRIQDELKALLDERKEVQRKINEVNARVSNK